VPSPAVSPAPIAYTKVVAVKKVQVRNQIFGAGSILLSNMNFGSYCFNGAEGLFGPNPLIICVFYSSSKVGVNNWLFWSSSGDQSYVLASSPKSLIRVSRKWNFFNNTGGCIMLL